jgi:beta-N-acetylhexosaminidase
VLRPAALLATAALTLGACGTTGDPDEAAQDVLAGLTDGQLAGTLVMTGMRADGPRVSRATRNAIRDGRIGGVILFSENARTLAQARRLTRELQAIPRPGRLANVPLAIAIDQEGGLVRRLTDAPPRISAAGLATKPPATAFESGRQTGRALRRAGITINFAPVADLRRSGTFLDRQRRAMGAARASAFAGGLERTGVAATLKHFPGLGRARVSTDDAPVTIRATRGQLQQDLDAFATAINAKPRLVMLSNAVYPALSGSGRPAVLDRRITTGLLRDRLGFRGVAVTDDLDVPALQREGGPARIAVKAVDAGADLLLYAGGLSSASAAQRALQQALKSGAVPRKRLREAAARVVALRRSG